jgi:small subunit ribosomal protein S15
MTERIKELTEHLRYHKKDHATRRGLLKLVGRRTALLRYLRRRDEGRYRTLLGSLNLRK